MNHSVYIFGDFGSGYTQYPDDFAKAILSKGVDGIKANSQIALHREGNLIYYSYYRKFLGGVSPKGYIGFSICFNGVYCTDTVALFGIFERYVTDLAVSGRLIEFSTDGDLLPKAGALYLQKEEIDRISASLSGDIERIATTSFKSLPPYNYGAGNNEEKHCAVSDAEKVLPKLIKAANIIVIHKDSDNKSAQFVGFAKQLSDLFSANQELNKQNEDLNNQVASLNKQKKQYKLVTALSILSILAIVGIIAFGHNILTLRGEVENKESIIVEKNEKIESLEKDVSKKDATISSLKRDIASKEVLISKRDSFMLGFASLTPCPIAISDIEIKNEDQDYGAMIYSSNTTYIYSRMTVHSLIDGTVDLYVKFYTPYGLSTGSSSPSGYSYTSTASLTKNQTTTIGVSGWGSSTKGHWKSGSYRIEYWYKGVCLGTKSFTIY